VRAVNEKYKDETKKDYCGHSRMIWPKEFHDLFGYEIKKGDFVIWHPYTRGGMHIGQVVHISNDFRNEKIQVKTAEGKIIERHGHELVLLLQHQLKLQSEEID